jgi:hypothetical protein
MKKYFGFDKKKEQIFEAIIGGKHQRYGLDIYFHRESQLCINNQIKNPNNFGYSNSQTRHSMKISQTASTAIKCLDVVIVKIMKVRPQDPSVGDHATQNKTFFSA